MVRVILEGELCAGFCLPKGVLVQNVLHLQWSLLRKELPVPVEQDSCAAAYVLQGAVPACGHWEWLGAYALCHSQPAGALCIVRGHKCGGCLCLFLPRPCPEQLHLVPAASDSRTVFVLNGYCMSVGWTDPQCSITLAGHLPYQVQPLLLKQVPVFVVWWSCACYPKSTRQRLAAGHLCVIAEAVLEPQLLLRKAESAKSSVALFCQVSP